VKLGAVGLDERDEHLVAQACFRELDQVARADRRRTAGQRQHEDRGQAGREHAADAAVHPRDETVNGCCEHGAHGC
jgi:hypothetical protein